MSAGGGPGAYGDALHAGIAPGPFKASQTMFLCLFMLRTGTCTEGDCYSTLLNNGWTPHTIVPHQHKDTVANAVFGLARDMMAIFYVVMNFREIPDEMLAPDSIDSDIKEVTVVRVVPKSEIQHWPNFYQFESLFT